MNGSLEKIQELNECSNLILVTERDGSAQWIENPYLEAHRLVMNYIEAYQGPPGGEGAVIRAMHEYYEAHKGDAKP